MDSTLIQLKAKGYDLITLLNHGSNEQLMQFALSQLPLSLKTVVQIIPGTTSQQLRDLIQAQLEDVNSQIAILTSPTSDNHNEVAN